MSNLILVRHGQSEWNLENKFTGWVDVDLAPNGKLEACKFTQPSRGADNICDGRIIPYATTTITSAANLRRASCSTGELKFEGVRIGNPWLSANACTGVLLILCPRPDALGF